MRTFIRRLLIVWLLFCVVCAAAIVVGRLDHTPTPLQTLGFDTCDGDPCFRGLKLGTERAQAQPLLSTGKWSGGDYYGLPIDKGDLGVSLTKDNRFVAQIILATGNYDDPFPITAGNVLIQYGPPCRVYFAVNREPIFVVLSYPTLDVTLIVAEDYLSYPNDFRLLAKSPVMGLNINHKDGSTGTYTTCSDPIESDGLLGPWHGFTSPAIYRSRNLHDLGLLQSTDDNP